jgi:rare lipoprotein A (peptidoglycan hydrolase)
MQHAASALNCCSAIAASVLIACIVPAAGEISAIEWDDHEMEAPASGLTLAALDPPAVNPESAGNERAIDRLAPNAGDRVVLYADEAIVGIASFYDDPQETASGEQYNPNAFTAAAQLEVRGMFGGVQFGRLYRAAYGLGEYGGKKIIVRFNDVGPLRPGRKFDLSRAAMAYFDSTLDKGLLPNFRMTPLPWASSRTPPRRSATTSWKRPQSSTPPVSRSQSRGPPRLPVRLHRNRLRPFASVPSRSRPRP